MMGNPKHSDNMAGYYLEGRRRHGLNIPRAASLLNQPRRSRGRGLSALLPKKRTIKDMIGALLFVGGLVLVESLSWFWGLR